nr:helix-turn-helix domain-containing protein [Allomuricauda sp.]
MMMGYLHAASIGLAVFIIALILGKRNRSVSDHFLVLWLFVLTVNFVSVFLLNTKHGEFVVWEQLLFEFSEASIFIHGPILYFYTLSLTTFSFELNPKIGLHAIPFLIAFSLLTAPIFYDEGVNFQLRNSLLICKMISLLVYVILVLRILFAHKKNVDDIFSNTEEKHLTWLFLVALGVLCLWTIAVVSLFLDRVMYLKIPQYGGLLTNIASSIFLFVIGYFGVKQPSLFVEYSKKVSTYRLEKENTKSKYEKSGLTEKQAIAIHRKTVELMNHEKSYLNPELTLYSLAAQLQVLPNHLSQAINSIEKKNFFDFINYYRIHEVKKCLESNEKGQLTLLGIAFECGFNSKTSFNRTFKKTEGMTPSEFRKKILNK